MDFSNIVSEDKIRKAYKDGEFDNLPGYGKPLKLDDDSAIPEDLRMAYRVMKNAGFINEETEIKKELLTFENLIDNCEDEEQRVIYQKKLNEKQFRLNQILKNRKTSHSAVFKDYQMKLHNKFK
ncbi:DnaJ family domain-containing protein [Bacillus sp. JJ1562]|uniref:DnaJ family domain-containing protein n=1 Tax=Bacillus sp. JJ1562 TaxID=3122960 RepID=UPI00300246E1